MKLGKEAQTFNLGDTSFRRKTLIDDYRTILPFLKETNLEFADWNNEAQSEFYKKILTETEMLDRNDREDFAKRGRTLTNALVKLGLVNGQRKLSKVALNWLKNDSQKADVVEKSLGIDSTNLLFTRQLLKLRVYASDQQSYFYPFRVGLELVKRYTNIPQTDFLTIIHLIQPDDSHDKITEIINGYNKVAANQNVFAEFLDFYFPEQLSEVHVEELFAGHELNRYQFDNLFVNRKSSTVQTLYFDFVQKLLKFKKTKTEEALQGLIKISSNDKIKKAFGFSKSLFVTKSKTIEEFLELNLDNPLLSDDDTQIYHQFVLSKKEDIVKEYRDMTKRTFNLSGLFDFSNGLVNSTNQKLCSIVFDTLVFAGKESYEDYEGNLVSSSFYQDLTISQILDLETDRVVENLKHWLKIDDVSKLEITVANQKEQKFREFISKHFPKEKIIKLLPLFSTRQDDELKKQVSDVATVPTIYEYIVAIAWYHLSSEKFSITKSLNLTLDGNMRPLSHASGGTGDIVIRYSDLTLMLEVTLMNSQAQKRGEWEPVLRHATNLTVEEYPKNVTTLFIADEFDDNTVNIWRAVASVPLKSSKTGELADLVKIFPLSNQELLEMLINDRNEKSLLTAIDSSYEVFSGNFNLGWRDDILSEAEAFSRMM